jgi:hypothetical protein
MRALVNDVGFPLESSPDIFFTNVDIEHSGLLRPKNGLAMTASGKMAKSSCINWFII